MLAVGYNYRVSDNASIAFHYAHAFFKDAEIDVTQPNSGSFTGTFKGKLDIVGASFTMNW